LRARSKIQKGLRLAVEQQGPHLLRRQASAFQLLASHLVGDEAQRFTDEAREAIAIASRIDATADGRVSA
jgi:hypothetical protein